MMNEDWLNVYILYELRVESFVIEPRIQQIFCLVSQNIDPEELFALQA